LLTRARHPIIITDSAGRQAECYAALVALAEVLAIPVIETSSALFSNFPKDNSLYAGPSWASSFEVADHVLVVRSRAPWYPPSRRPPHATVVLIDENPYREHMAYQNVAADIVLDGDATFTLQMLLKIAHAGEMDDDAIKQRRAYQTTRHAQREDARRAAIAAAGKMRPIDPIWLCAAMSELLPADAWPTGHEPRRELMRSSTFWTNG
jgi:acetolactate synthase I/II/III large subunit